MKTQINNEKANVWNGKIGMLTASEYIMANTDYTVCGTFLLVRDNVESWKNGNYLYNDSYQWWLITPPTSNTYDVKDPTARNTANVILSTTAFL